MEKLVIRAATIADAREILNLKLALDAETTFMLVEHGERSTDVEDERRSLNNLLSRPNCAMFLAEVDKHIVGYISAEGGAFSKNKHVACVIIGIKKSCSRQGVGSALFQTLEAWAKTAGIGRLELTVMVHNASAIALYKRMGFEKEGMRRCSIFLDGAFVDEIYMAKISVSNSSGERIEEN